MKPLCVILFYLPLALLLRLFLSFFPFLSLCPFLISRRKFSTEWEHPWRRQYVLSLRSLCLSSLSRMQFSTEWDINGGVMLTDWPEEFEEASEQNLADTNLVVNSGQLPVGKKKNIRPLLLCLVNLSSNGIVQTVSLSLLFLDFGFGSLRRQNSGQKPKRRTPLRSGPRRRSLHTKQGHSPSTLRRFNFSRKKSVRQSQRLHVWSGGPSKRHLRNHRRSAFCQLLARAQPGWTECILHSLHRVSAYCCCYCYCCCYSCFNLIHRDECMWE